MVLIKPLDTLRALAITLVVFFHSPVPLFQLQFGWAGVNLFFILSGFLITRILLAAKEAPVKTYLKNFYARRALRIFPLYYLYLILAGVGLVMISKTTFIANNGFLEAWVDFQNHWPFLISYTYNFEEVINYLTHTDYNNSYFFGHLWSLSVEEQFYFVFPFIVYFTPVKWLKRILLFLIVLIPLLRLLAVGILEKNVQDLFWVGDILYISTVFQLDTLSLGACLALFDFSKFDKIARPLTLSLGAVMIIVGLTHLFLAREYGVRLEWSTLGFDIPVYHTMTFSPNYWFNNRYFYSIPLINFTFASCVLWAIRSKAPLRILENKTLMRIGKISYGIYIHHLCLSFLVGLVFESGFKRNVTELGLFSQSLTFICYLLLLLLTAEISYRFYESKFLRLKERFTME